MPTNYEELVAIVLPLWILAFLLYFRTTRRILALTVTLTVTGAVLGVCAGLIVASGGFAPWESMGAPPGGAVAILQITESTIYVEAADEAVYSCDFRDRTQCWVRTQLENLPPRERPLELVYPGAATPVVTIAEREASIRFQHFEGGGSTKFRLEKDGSVSTRSTSDFFGALMLLGFPIAGAGLGLFASVAILLVRCLRSRKPSQEVKSGVTEAR